MTDRVASALPVDYHDRWLKLAEWSIQHVHGPGCRYALMYALALRRSALASWSSVSHVRPRVWQVETRTCTSQRVSLFADGVTKSLLDMVETTKDLPTPLYPNAPCGSHNMDDWTHGLAKRKLFRGHTNFQALSVDFGIEAGPKWTPLEIYLVSLAVFRSVSSAPARDECAVLMNQLGLVTPKSVFYHSRCFHAEARQELLRIALEGADMHASACDVHCLSPRCAN